MRNKIILSVSAVALLALTSCSKLGALSADNFAVTPNPLETVAGQVPATINGTFPEKYMKKKAVVTVTPELRYGNGLVAKGSPATFQGEKVQGNDQTISYLVGGHYTMKSNFKYVPEMQKSDMYLTFDAKIGKRQVEVPAVKVATGVIATSELAKRTVKSANACVAPDAYQRIVAQKQEANIKFLIQQANLRKSELKNNSVQEFVRLLKQIKKDKEGLNLKNVEVSAYASPDGGYDLNDKLAAQRQKVSQKYVNTQMKQTKVDGEVDANYTAEDWDGFQKLVEASNIQDKDIILRVLSMYKDPQERETQIRNISAAYKELADEILPELRRSRLTVNYETVGRDDNQIQTQLDTDASKLSVEEMLYAANLKQTANDKEDVYKKVIAQYPNDYRAYNNVAAMEYAKGNYDEATKYAKQALAQGADASDANANLGLIALCNGNTQEAENLIAKSTGANGQGEVLGNLNLMKGNYAQAVKDFGTQNTNSSALALLLNKDYASAAVALKYVKNPDAVIDYLKAIVSARTGDTTAAAESLKSALAKDSSLAQYAANDLELAKVSK